MAEQNMNGLVAEYLRAVRTAETTQKDAAVAAGTAKRAEIELKKLLCGPIQGTDDPDDVSSAEVRAWLAGWAMATVVAGGEPICLSK